jgi:uncharacterized protein YabE (DUF348 family)
MIAAQATLLTAVVGASVIYAAAHKTVTLSVDGHVSHVRSMSGTVSDFLESQEIKVSGRDLVAPTPTAPLNDGSEVVVRYARPLTLTVDGHQQTYWTTELSVDRALSSLGVRIAGAQMSASRSQPIGRAGLTMWLSTPKQITLVVGGKKQKITTTAPTVSVLLTSRGLAVGALDKLSDAPAAPLEEGMTVKLVRIERKQVTRRESVRYDVIKHKTSTLYVGQTKVIKAGKAGRRTATYVYTIADGKVTKRTLITAHTLVEPVTAVVKVGTKQRSSNVGGDVDSLNWAALAQCESGGNPKAVNPAGYYGLYQFSLATWHSVGGTGNPIDHSASEQTYRAKLLYKRTGASSWGCGEHLFD